MSYLVLPAGIPDFSKAIVSLWFRVPKSSIEAKIVQGEFTPAAYFFILPYTIPLLTFGRPQINRRYQGNYQDVSMWQYEPAYPFTKTPIYDSPTFGLVADDPVDPSYIGILCERTATPDGELRNRARLVINIQMGDYASVFQKHSNRSRVEVYPFGKIPPGFSTAKGSGWRAGTFDNIFGIFHTTLVDSSTAQKAQPEFFKVISSHELAPDHWHHLLLSFDVSRRCVTRAPPANPSASGAVFWDNVAQGTSEHCRLWYAIDDVDYRGGDNMGPYSVDYDLSGTSGNQGDPNGILTQNAFDVAFTGTQYPFNCPFGPATCDYGPLPIPSSGAELGIPAASSYVDHVLKVELAELQCFTGITLDTGVTANRRAFVDVDGKPVKPADTEQRLLKQPDILLHGTGNWKVGKNTGSLGVDIAGEPIPSGQFRRTGVIDAYKPDPSLHGQQSRQAAPVQLTRIAAASLDARL